MKKEWTKKQRMAVQWYRQGKEYSVSTFIDEETLTYGYGELSHLGEWEYEIPAEALCFGEAKTRAELLTKSKDQQ